MGRHVVQRALADERVTSLVVPSRSSLAEHPKLSNPRVNYETTTGEEAWWSVDAVVCCLGTTRKLAGSKEQFYRVDHDYVVASAQRAHAAGCRVFAYNSASGAGSPLMAAFSHYMKTKVATERDLRGIGFESLTFVRPGLLEGGERPDDRPGEDFGLALDRTLGFMIPRSARAIDVRDVARCLLKAALGSAPGEHVVESRDIPREAE